MSHFRHFVAGRPSGLRTSAPICIMPGASSESTARGPKRDGNNYNSNIGFKVIYSGPYVLIYSNYSSMGNSEC